MIEFSGYRIKSTNIQRVENILREAKKNLRSAAESEFHRMLSEEVCEVVDDIALNVMPRPNYPILQAAQERLNEAIGKAEMSSSGTEYDLRSGVTIIPDKEYTYLILHVSNDVLKKAFGDTKGIEPYKVTEEDTVNGDKTPTALKWDELQKRCANQPALMSATLTNKIELDTSLLEFEAPLDRARTRARRTMTARLMNQYACGTEIRNTQLMMTLDKALSKMLSPDVQREVDGMVAQLAATLPEITLEMVMADPTKPAPYEYPEEGDSSEPQSEPAENPEEDKNA